MTQRLTRPSRHLHRAGHRDDGKRSSAANRAEQRVRIRRGRSVERESHHHSAQNIRSMSVERANLHPSHDWQLPSPSTRPYASASGGRRRSARRVRIDARRFPGCRQDLRRFGVGLLAHRVAQQRDRARMELGNAGSLTPRRAAIDLNGTSSKQYQKTILASRYGRCFTGRSSVRHSKCCPTCSSGVPVDSSASEAACRSARSSNPTSAAPAPVPSAWASVARERCLRDSQSCARSSSATAPRIRTRAYHSNARPRSALLRSAPTRPNAPAEVRSSRALVAHPDPPSVGRGPPSPPPSEEPEPESIWRPDEDPEPPPNPPLDDDPPRPPDEDPPRPPDEPPKHRMPKRHPPLELELAETPPDDPPDVDPPDDDPAP
jgi:hypothetical protein